MGQPVLAEYLLKLATNVAEHDAYKNGDHRERRGLLVQAGLGPEQLEAVMSGNIRRITEALMDEFAREGVGKGQYTGVVLTFVMSVDHLQLMTPEK